MYNKWFPLSLSQMNMMIIWKITIHPSKYGKNSRTFYLQIAQILKREKIVWHYRMNFLKNLKIMIHFNMLLIVQKPKILLPRVMTHLMLILQIVKDLKIHWNLKTLAFRQIFKWGDGFLLTLKQINMWQSRSLINNREVCLKKATQISNWKRIRTVYKNKQR